MVVAALAFLVWDILITTDEEVILFSCLISVALEADLVSTKGQICMAVRPVLPSQRRISGSSYCNYRSDSSEGHGHTPRPFISSYVMYLSW